MKLTPRQYALALHQAVSETAAGDLEKVLDRFVGVLKDNGDLGKAGEIEREFLNYDKELRGIKTAQVTSAKPLSGAEEQRIIKELNAYVGGQVELKKQVDAGILGGVVIRLGDEVIDSSVSRSLKDLEEKLVKP